MRKKRQKGRGTRTRAKTERRTKDETENKIEKKYEVGVNYVTERNAGKTEKPRKQ